MILIIVVLLRYLLFCIGCKIYIFYSDSYFFDKTENFKVSTSLQCHVICCKETAGAAIETPSSLAQLLIQIATTQNDGNSEGLVAVIPLSVRA